MSSYRLIEQNYGVFEGAFRDNKDFKEAKRHFPNKLSGGESILQVAQRIFNLRIINAYFNDQSNEEFYHFHVGNCELKEYHI